MEKRVLTLGFLALSLSFYAQQEKTPVRDTLKIQEIEDINLHKTGNPNKARTQSAKSNLTVMENPQPISIVTHEIIEQQQNRQLSDVLQNVNGLYVTSSRGNSQDSFGGRGFNFGNENIFKNGARVNSGVFPEVSGLERVEVLKGGNAMLYGNVAAGGVVNLITKKPRFNFGGSVGLSAGSWDTYKPTVDFYGPLSEKTAFRVNGAYEYADSFRDVVESRKSYFNPSFLFNIGEKSQLIVEADYLNHDFTPDFGIGSIENKDKSYAINTLLPRTAFLGTDWQYQHVQQVTSGITFNHQFSNSWTLNSTASYQNYTKDYFSTERPVWTYDNNNRLKWNRPVNKTYNEQNYASLQINLNGEVKTGDINHKLLLGTDGDYGTADTYTYKVAPALHGTNGNANGLIYLDDPATWTGGAMPSSKLLERNRIPTQRFGVYVQDFVELSEKFKILAGLRWSYLENLMSEKTTYSGTATPVTSGTVDRAFSPKAGLVYMPNDNISVFGTYTNSFSANTGMDVKSLEALRPSVIDQFEVGIKTNFWNNAVALNVTGYQILNRNFYQTAEFKGDGTVNNDANYKDFAGKMRSRGVELDITGNPTSYLSIIAGASYNHAVYLDTPAEFGYVENQRLVRTPATTANASVFYTFPSVIKGLKLGASVYYIGDRLAGWNDTKKTLKDRGQTRIIEIGSYSTVGLSLGYDWKKVSLMGRVNNLFDVEDYTYHENYSVNPITPRNYYVTLTYKL